MRVKTAREVDRQLWEKRVWAANQDIIAAYDRQQTSTGTYDNLHQRRAALELALAAMKLATLLNADEAFL